MTKPSPRRVVVVSHVVHYRHDGRLYAYGAYAREIDVWADLFPEVVIAAPCRTEAPPDDTVSFTRSNISIEPLPETGGERTTDKIASLLHLPRLVWTLGSALRRADAAHVRCPGNWGLLGSVLAPVFCPLRIAKYAGQWPDYPNEALTYRLQKHLLRSRWWHAPVTVYGDWSGQPEHVVPFFTSVMTLEQMAHAREVAAHKRFTDPIKVVFVGRLSRAKNVNILLEAAAALRREGLVIECEILGDGPCRDDLENQARRDGLERSVRFHGAVEFDRVLAFYDQAHVLVLASETEGWPKAIAEAMAHGLVCIGSDRGLVSQMLGDDRGVTVAPGDVSSLVDALRALARDPARCQRMSARAAAWSAHYSLEGLRDALRELMEQRWGVTLRATA